MTDLTAITTPFGLLDRETQEALKAHGGPYQDLADDGWQHVSRPSWGFTRTYRVKPAPPKPREWWRSESDGQTYLCEPHDKAAFMDGYVRVREVLPE